MRTRDLATSVYHHYHNIKLCSFIDVDWCLYRDLPIQLSQRTWLRLSTTIITSLYFFLSQTWTGVATRTVKTRDFVTSVYHHYHVIILCSFTDVDWCNDKDYEDTGLRYVCLPSLLCHCVPSQTWTGVATRTVRTRDFVTSVYHHYSVIVLFSFIDVDWCSDRECEDTGPVSYTHLTLPTNHRV